MTHRAFLARITSRWRGVLTALAVAPLLTSSVVRTYGWMVILGDRGIIITALRSSGLTDGIIRLITNYFGATVTLVEILMPYAILDHGGSPVLTVPSDRSLLNKAVTALTREWGRPSVIIGDGGSIPLEVNASVFWAWNTLFIGFAQNDDRIHSPNEKYDLTSFHKGIRNWVRLLDAFAR